MPPDKAKVFRRPSARLTAEKTQPLAAKISAVLVRAGKGLGFRYVRQGC